MEHPLKRTAKELNQAIQNLGDDVMHAVTVLGQLHGQIEQVDLNKLFIEHEYTKELHRVAADHVVTLQRELSNEREHVTGLQRDKAILTNKNKEQMHTIMHDMKEIDDRRATERGLLEDIDRLTGKRQADALAHERAMSELAEVHAARVDTMHDELANARQEANQIVTDMQDELAAHILRNARLQAENDELRFHAQHADPHMPTPCVVPFPWHRDKK